MASLPRTIDLMIRQPPNNNTYQGTCLLEVVCAWLLTTVVIVALAQTLRLCIQHSAVANQYTCATLLLSNISQLTQVSSAPLFVHAMAQTWGHELQTQLPGMTSQIQCTAHRCSASITWGHHQKLASQWLR